MTTRFAALTGIMLLCLVIATASRAAAPPAPPAPPAAPAAPAARDNLAAQWEDFVHYIRVARDDLALANGKALLAADGQKLLDVIESSRVSEDYQRALDTAAKNATLHDLALSLGRKILDAQIARSRDTKRIEADIRKLGGTANERHNASIRLKAAGQFAAPQLLAFLVEEKEKTLHPQIVSQMILMGRPMVEPLSIALGSLEPRPMTQVATVLGQIGYPRALPYLKQVAENGKLDKDARAAATAAYDRIASSTPVSPKASAADIFLFLAQKDYTTATLRPEEVPGFDAQSGAGIVWYYSRDIGLTSKSVPGIIYGDVMAMRAAEWAIELDPSLDTALSLWLAANLRRENRLPAGQKDPTYKHPQPADFYAQMAGPARLNEVLDAALRDQDAALALDAIKALGATAGTKELISNSQPLLRALYHPDRRVRYSAAFTMANARPRSEFPGSFRVVPVLAEAIRQTAVRYAMVVASSQETRNQLSGMLTQNFGYQVRAYASLKEAEADNTGAPGFDAIVLAGSAETAGASLVQIYNSNRYATVPVVLVLPPNSIAPRVDGAIRQPFAATDGNAESLKAALDAASKSGVGAAIGDEEATQIATGALRLLHNIGGGYGEVFRITDAEPALISALRDSRPEIARLAATVLARIGNGDAQRAIAEAALAPNVEEPQRIAFLNSLADSATQFGNFLDANTTDKLLALVKSSKGELALAASRAHGALTLPTANMVKMIIE